MAKHMDARVFLILMAARMVGDYLYSWGGEETEEGGFDCSGFVSVALMQATRAWPGLYDGGRQTAAGLYQHYHQRNCPDIQRVEDLTPGSLLFYRLPGKKIHHIAIHATNVPDLRMGDRKLPVGPLAFESGGGGSRTTSPREALISSAGVRLTASDQHGRNVEWIGKDPFLLLDITPPA